MWVKVGGFLDTFSLHSVALGSFYSVTLYGHFPLLGTFPEFQLGKKKLLRSCNWLEETEVFPSVCDPVYAFIIYHYFI